MTSAAATTESYRAYRDLRRFGSLDGLRFLCIFAVLWHHGPYLDTTAEPVAILSRGFLGVDFFFVLSGFLITTLLLREEARDGSFSLRQFYWRRICRIVPVYFLVVTLAAFLFIGLNGERQYLDILPYYYLFLSNFLTEDIPLLAPTWSLAVEEQYYLLWPLLLLVLPRRWIVPVLLTGIALNVAGAMGLLAVFGIRPVQVGELFLALPTATYAPILMGSLTALLLHDPRGFAAAFRLLGHRYAPLAAFLGLAIVIQLAPADIAGLPNLAIHAMMCLSLITIVVREDHVLRPVLAFRPVARVGEISYGIYLYHLFALHAVVQIAPDGALGPTFVFVAYTLVSILVAELSFRTVEAYFMKLKSRRPFATRATAQGPSGRPE